MKHYSNQQVVSNLEIIFQRLNCKTWSQSYKRNFALKMAKLIYIISISKYFQRIPSWSIKMFEMRTQNLLCFTKTEKTKKGLSLIFFLRHWTWNLLMRNKLDAQRRNFWCKNTPAYLEQLFWHLTLKYIFNFSNSGK